MYLVNEMDAVSDLLALEEHVQLAGGSSTSPFMSLSPCLHSNMSVSPISCSAPHVIPPQVDIDVHDVQDQVVHGTTHKIGMQHCRSSHLCREDHHEDKDVCLHATNPEGCNVSQVANEDHEVHEIVLHGKGNMMLPWSDVSSWGA